MNREEILKEAEKYFFEAMRNGWAAGVKGVDVPGISGHKEISHQYHNGRVVDRYCVSSAGKSAGTTTIWHFNDPVWFMSYGGYYRKEDIPFLKQALMTAYERDEFFGCRGPRDMKLPNGLIYSNRMSPPSICNISSCTFSSFDGIETIKDSQGAIGWHDYWGMALI